MVRKVAFAVVPAVLCLLLLALACEGEAARPGRSMVQLESMEPERKGDPGAGSGDPSCGHNGETICSGDEESTASQLESAQPERKGEPRAGSGDPSCGHNGETICSGDEESKASQLESAQPERKGEPGAGSGDPSCGHNGETIC